MKQIKKYWWIGVILIAVILLIVLLAVKNTNQVEYKEIGDGPHLKGNAVASVSLIEYSDFQCPACASAAEFVKGIAEEYGDKIKFEYRHFPLNMHRYAYVAAEASECAADQGKFWEYHDLLFLNQDKLAKSDLARYASQVEGLDTTLCKNRLTSGVKAKRVDDDLAEVNSQRYNFTPTFILNGQKVEDWSQLENRIKALVEPLVPMQLPTIVE